MSDPDSLARGLVAGATRLADRGALLARGVAVMAMVVAGLAFVLGLAATDGGARTVWIVIGGIGVVIVVGAPLLARSRLRSVKRDATDLIDEVRRVVAGDRDAERVVIDIETGETDPRSTGRRMPGLASAGGPAGPAVIAQSQRYGELRRIVSRANDVRKLPGAIAALVTFPGLLAISLLGSFVFAVLGFVFLLAWVL